MDTVRAELSGNPDDIDENYLVILDTYGEDGIHKERQVTPYMNKAKACEAYDALRLNEEPGRVSWLCKLLCLEAVKNEFPVPENEDSKPILPT